jgi:hypothetical protein
MIPAMETGSERCFMLACGERIWYFAGLYLSH